MRYYLYISDTKVEMIFPQVPGATQQRVASKFGFDVKILSGSISTDRTTYDSRIARLQAVEEYVRDSDEVGDFSAKTPWISGIVSARFVDIGNNAILFVYKDEASLIALGGSRQHLLGSSPPERVYISQSFLQSLTNTLTGLVEREPKFLTELPEDEMKRHLAEGIHQGFAAWISVLRSVWEESSSTPPQKIEFLAKRLVTTSTGISGEECTLATPLYVALAE